jgi:MFS family permease
MSIAAASRFWRTAFSSSSNGPRSTYGWIVFAFQLACAVMMVFSGGIIDALGTRTGYVLAMAWWSIAAMGHALARGVLSFAAVRFLLGAGEPGNCHASIKAVAEWFPKRERALATGIFKCRNQHWRRRRLSAGRVAAAEVGMESCFSRDRHAGTRLPCDLAGTLPAAAAAPMDR